MNHEQDGANTNRPIPMDDMPNSTLKIGTVLHDKWVIVEFIAKGGMGEVYRAHQPNLKRDVAVKVISRGFLECIEDEEEVQTALERLRREVQVMAGLRHPNIVQIIDYGSDTIQENGKETPIEFIVMEFIPGSTLRATMSELGFDPEEGMTRDWLVSFFLPVLDGVENAHKLDIIHRDLKPENVLMDRTVPKIVDFGLARSCRWRSVTQSMDMKGTLMYMPPEQFSDFRRTDERSDIYALGKIIYEAVVGKLSTKGPHFKQVRLDDPETSFFQALDRIIQKATAEERSDRYQSIEELRAALLDALSTLEQPQEVHDFPPLFHRPKWIWIGIVIAVASVGLMTVWHLLGEPGMERHPRPPSASVSTGPPVPGSPIEQAEPIVTEDEMTLRHVPGGKMELPEPWGQTAVESFYMDETPVTNHQFIAFLNEVLPKVTVADGIVIGEGSVWLLLGEVVEGYDPIDYSNGKFILSHSGHAACPVLRVTAFGAAAYAEQYGKRLPSAKEWLYVYQKGLLYAEGDTELTEKMPIPTPVIVLEPNIFRIRGLNQGINEWVVRSPDIEMGSNSEPEFAVAGNARIKNPKSPVYRIERYPWEAFRDVGFRCVLTPPGKEPFESQENINDETGNSRSEDSKGEGK